MNTPQSPETADEVAVAIVERPPRFVIDAGRLDPLRGCAPTSEAFKQRDVGRPTKHPSNLPETKPVATNRGQDQGLATAGRRVIRVFHAIEATENFVPPIAQLQQDREMDGRSAEPTLAQSGSIAHIRHGSIGLRTRDQEESPSFETGFLNRARNRKALTRCVRLKQVHGAVVHRGSARAIAKMVRQRDPSRHTLHERPLSRRQRMKTSSPFERLPFKWGGAAICSKRASVADQSPSAPGVRPCACS